MLIQYAVGLMPRNGQHKHPSDTEETDYRPRMYGSHYAHKQLRLIEEQALAGEAGEAFQAIIARITADLTVGEPDLLSEMEKHLVMSFAGAALLQGRQHSKILQGQPLNPHEYVSVALAMQRAAKVLGFHRRAKSINAPSLRQYLERGEADE